VTGSQDDSSRCIPHRSCAFLVSRLVLDLSCSDKEIHLELGAGLRLPQSIQIHSCFICQADKGARQFRHTTWSCVFRRRRTYQSIKVRRKPLVLDIGNPSLLFSSLNQILGP
jgi:hypothetical protein